MPRRTARCDGGVVRRRAGRAPCHRGGAGGIGKRARGRDLLPDRIESERDEFFERVRAAYRARAEADPARFRVLDASRPAAAVAAEAVRQLQAWRDRA